MSHAIFPSGGRALRSRRRRRFSRILAVTASAAVAGSFLLPRPPALDDTLTVASSRTPIKDSAPRKRIVTASGEIHRWLLDPTPSGKPETLVFANEAAHVAAFLRLAAPPAETEAPTVLPQPGPPPNEEAVKAAEAVPLPVPRPADLQALKSAAPAQAAQEPASRRNQTAALPAAPPVDNRSFFQKLLGVAPQAPGQALGYAGLNGGVGLPSGSQPAVAAGIAVYDIGARLVYMPNGETLEAHSGLGDKRDDPRFVHVRMHGATPPGVYDLTEREQLFHGVRAIRLNPVGGSTTIHGRTGLLAHTYLLGPNGDSNGCVSFKHYDKFLQAFLKGEVKRLVVVSGRGQDRLPSIAKSGATGRANDT